MCEGARALFPRILGLRVQGLGLRAMNQGMANNMETTIVVDDMSHSLESLKGVH